MNTRIEKVESENLNNEIINEAAKILNSGGLVAFPTETVYGLGADALNPYAAEKIYSAKGRPSDNPLIIHIADLHSLETIAKEVSSSANKLMERFWPGPLTLILKKTEKVPYKTTGGLDTVAVRMPSHPVALALIKESGIYIAAPSANASGKPSPTKASHVIEDLEGKINMILDGGNVGLGLESTIVDMTTDKPVILRPGFITKEMIEEVIGEIDKATPQSDKPKAPGMKYRHYAPEADLFIVEGEKKKVIDKINHMAKENSDKGISVGVIATDESIDFYQYGKILSIGSRNNINSIAYNLYNVLRKFNHTEVKVIYCESFSQEKGGQAIMNRLKKASSNRVIYVDTITNIEE